MTARLTHRSGPDRFADALPSPGGIRGSTDVTACDREPIAIPGSVQPHGALFLLDGTPGSGTELTVRRASANAVAFVGVEATLLLDAPLSRALGSAGAAEVAAALTATAEGRVGPLLLDLAGLADGDVVVRPCDLTLHRTPAGIVLEIEESLPAAALTTGHTSRALLRLQATPDLTALLQQTVVEVADLTGFDRVMLYRFNLEGDGEVVAEQLTGSSDSYLGLHYPGSDIPRQARELYRRQWLRLIVDSDYVPAPILPLETPDGPEPLDLSHAALRSVSPVHLQYLRNMGVSASMSMSLVVEDQLWGLILCHASTRHPVPSAQRTACEQIAQFVSLQLEARRLTARLSGELRAQQLRSTLVDQMSAPAPVEGLRGGEPGDAPHGDAGLLDVLVADTAAARLEGQTVIAGRGLTPTLADQLVALLRSGPAAADGSFASNSLRADAPAVAKLLDEHGAGSLAGLLLAPSPEGDPANYLLWLRREVEQTVNWAGQPTVKHQSGTLSPRASFELWREKVRDSAEPWQSVDLENAAALTDAVSARLRRLQEMDLAAAAARSQQMFQREHEIADALQRGMLPVLPELDDLALAASYVSASESAEVGGDWYDVFTLPDGSTGIAMGDVTGHDLSAAAAMGQLRSVLRSYAWEESRPEQVLDKVDALVSGFAMRHLATVFFARLERDGGDEPLLRYANAGHPPPMLKYPDGTVEVLDDGLSVLIGVGIGIAHESSSRRIPSGATLVLYTDGLVEQRSREISEGIDLLRAVVAGGPDDAEALRDHVLGHMVPGRREDDIAVLVVRVD